MKKHIKKLFLIITIFSLLATNISETSTVFANSNKTTTRTQFTTEQNKLIEEGFTSENITISNDEAPTLQYGTRSIQTKSVKKAIKAVIKNRNKIVNVVGRYIGRDAAVSVGASLNTVMPVLNKLQFWSDLTYGTVEGQVKNALTAVGMVDSQATTIAYWVRLALEWVI